MPISRLLFDNRYYCVIKRKIDISSIKAYYRWFLCDDKHTIVDTFCSKLTFHHFSHVWLHLQWNIIVRNPIFPNHSMIVYVYRWCHTLKRMFSMQTCHTMVQLIVIVIYSASCYVFIVFLFVCFKTNICCMCQVFLALV